MLTAKDEESIAERVELSEWGSSLCDRYTACLAKLLALAPSAEGGASRKQLEQLAQCEEDLQVAAENMLCSDRHALGSIRCSKRETAAAVKDATTTRAAAVDERARVQKLYQEIAQQKDLKRKKENLDRFAGQLMWYPSVDEGEREIRTLKKEISDLKIMEEKITAVKKKAGVTLGRILDSLETLEELAGEVEKEEPTRKRHIQTSVTLKKKNQEHSRYPSTSLATTGDTKTHEEVPEKRPRFV